MGRQRAKKRSLALHKTTARALLACVIGLAGICRPTFSFCVYTLCRVTEDVRVRVVSWFNEISCFQRALRYNFVVRYWIVLVRLMPFLSRFELSWPVRCQRLWLQPCAVNLAESAQHVYTGGSRDTRMSDFSDSVDQVISAVVSAGDTSNTLHTQWQTVSTPPTTWQSAPRLLNDSQTVSTLHTQW